MTETIVLIHESSLHLFIICANILWLPFFQVNNTILTHTHAHTITQSLAQAADMCCLVPRSTGSFLTALQWMKAVVTTRLVPPVCHRCPQNGGHSLVRSLVLSVCVSDTNISSSSTTSCEIIPLHIHHAFTVSFVNSAITSVP